MSLGKPQSAFSGPRRPHGNGAPGSLRHQETRHLTFLAAGHTGAQLEAAVLRRWGCGKRQQTEGQGQGREVDPSLEGPHLPSKEGKLMSLPPSEFPEETPVMKDK